MVIEKATVQMNNWNIPLTPRAKIGYSGENAVCELEILTTPQEGFTYYLETENAEEEANNILLTPDYVEDRIYVLLTTEMLGIGGILQAQIVAYIDTEEEPVKKSNVFQLEVDSSINATKDVESHYQTALSQWAQILKEFNPQEVLAKLQEVEAEVDSLDDGVNYITELACRLYKYNASSPQTDPELYPGIREGDLTIASGTMYYAKTVTDSAITWQPLSTGGGGTGGGVGFSCWKDKSMVCVGDSITAGSGTTKIYYNILLDLLDLESVTGMGVAGSCVSATSNYGTGNSPLINRWTSIPDADVITIFMGTNDYGHNTPLGTIADTTDISFYGALNVIIPGILNAHPNSRLVWVTPMHRYNFGGFVYDWDVNGVGNTLEDYCKAIKAVCHRYSVPVIDLYEISGLNPAVSPIKTTYVPDGLHPNALGHEKIAGYMAKYLNLYSQYLPEGSENVNVTGVTLSDNSITIGTDGTATISANITPSNATNQNVTWDIVSGSEYVSITPNGLICVIEGNNAVGNSTVRVTTQDGNYTATCSVSVTSQSISVTGVELSGLNEVNENASITLTATITPTTATNKNVTWTITSGSEYVSITPNGLTCTVAGIAEGNAEITVTTQDGNYTDTMNITVLAGAMWELSYGNKYATEPALKTAHNRLTPVNKQYYFEAGTVLKLNDNITYKWQICHRNSADDYSEIPDVNYWIIPPGNGWVNTKNFTILSSGWYGIAILKANNTDFDLSIESSNAFDYITAIPAN